MDTSVIRRAKRFRGQVSRKRMEEMGEYGSAQGRFPELRPGFPTRHMEAVREVESTQPLYIGQPTGLVGAAAFKRTSPREFTQASGGEFTGIRPAGAIAQERMIRSSSPYTYQPLQKVRSKVRSLKYRLKSKFPRL